MDGELIREQRKGLLNKKESKENKGRVQKRAKRMIRE